MFRRVAFGVGLALFLGIGVSRSRGAHARQVAPYDVDGRIAYLVSELSIGEMRGMDIPSPPNEGVAARNELVVIGKRAVPALLKALDSKNDWTQGHAIEALAMLRERSAVQRLALIMDADREQGVRASAAAALGTIGDREAIPALTRALRIRKPTKTLYDNPAQIALCAATSLTKMGDRASIRAIAALLSSNDTSTRVYPGGTPLPLGGEIATLLPSFGRECVPFVVPLLHRGDGQVRLRAATVLAAVGDARGTGILVAGLGDSSHYAAGEGLRALADPRLLPRFRRMLHDKSRDGIALRILEGYPAKDVAGDIVSYLRNLGDQEFESTVVWDLTGIKDHNFVPYLVNMAHHIDRRKRRAVVELLSSLAFPEALDFLRKSARDGMLDEADWGLAKLDPGFLMPYLRKGGKDEWSAVSALAAARYEGVRPYLLEQVSKSAPESSAVQWLGYVGKTEDTAVLMPLIHDARPEMRDAALTAILRIRGIEANLR